MGKALPETRLTDEQRDALTYILEGKLGRTVRWYARKWERLLGPDDAYATALLGVVKQVAKGRRVDTRLSMRTAVGNEIRKEAGYRLRYPLQRGDDMTDYLGNDALLDLNRVSLSASDRLRLLGALRCLPRGEYRIMKQRFVYGLPWNEIARKLGIRNGADKNKKRSIKKLATLLANEEYVFGAPGGTGIKIRERFLPLSEVSRLSGESRSVILKRMAKDWPAIELTKTDRQRRAEKRVTNR